jgi:transposase-like protein
VHSFLKVVNAYCREQFQRHLIRALAYCKFYLGLSLRQIQSACKWFFNQALSLRAIARHLDDIGQRAAIVIESLSTFPQKMARLLLLDEMFIKIKKNTAYLCLAIDENGLIRGVRLLSSRSAEELKKVIGQTLGPCFRPLKVLTDFWRGYDEAVTETLGEACRHYHDFVHAIRICFRRVDDAVRKTKLVGTASKTLARKEIQALGQLKKRLVRGQLLRVMKNLLAVFSPLAPTEPVTSANARPTAFLAVYQERRAVIENALAKLDKIPGAGARHFKKALDKFFKKYLAEFVELLLDVKDARDRGERMPTTTNMIESKNSLLKPLIKIIKSFRHLKKAENLFSGVTLFQNFRVDSRGKNKGTNAIQRAALQIQAKDFFEAVGLTMDDAASCRSA